MKQAKNTTPRHTSKDPYTLFDISDEIKFLIVDIGEAQAEKDPELVAELTDELLDIIELHENKYEATVHVIKNSLNAADGNKTISDQFAAKATAHNNIAKGLKERLKQDMKEHGLKTVEAGIFTVRTQKNSIPTLKIDVNPEELPIRFHRIETNNEELKYALTKGEEVEGATLEKGEHLRITAKT